MQRHKTVEEFLSASQKWRSELTRLREILNSTKLEETVKWGGPVYTFGGKNVVGIGGFKEFYTLWFFQGALLKDEHQVLINAQEGRTKALRQWRFHEGDKIHARLIKAYVKEAIQLAADGKEIKPERRKTLVLPLLLRQALASDSRAKACFADMSAGKQREYADYIAAAKREDTKQKRLAKILPMILANQGLHDKYR